MARLRPDVERIEVDECVTLTDAEGNLHVLNSTAGMMLDGWLNGRPKQETIRALMEKFNVDETLASEDYDSFIDELRQSELFEQEASS